VYPGSHCVNRIIKKVEEISAVIQPKSSKGTAKS
jgi:copper chaperone CopZ